MAQGGSDAKEMGKATRTLSMDLVDTLGIDLVWAKHVNHLGPCERRSAKFNSLS